MCGHVFFQRTAKPGSSWTEGGKYAEAGCAKSHWQLPSSIMMRGRESYDELMDHTDKEQRRAAITTGFDHASSDQINVALDLPNGARYYRCALQVNPFA